MSIAHQIKKLFFSNEFVSLDVSYEGQTCNENSYVLGSKTGPVTSISGLLHEVCHFAELEPQRLLKFPSGNWGLYPGKFWQFGQNWGYEQSTDQQVQREARVWAYQLSAEKHFGINHSAEQLVRSATWLPAWCYYKFQFKTSRFVSDSKRLYYLAKHVERLSKRNSFEKLLEDFDHRVKFLRENSKS